MQNKKLITIFLIQVTEVLGFSLILPYLPLLTQDLGASPVLTGIIISSFSLFQFISAPIMGQLSDKYGRRPLLLLSQISTFISFIILGLSNTLWLVFISRAIDGILGSNFTIAQAYLSDISTKKDRSKVFGLSGMAFGVGFLIGPAIGGYLSRFGYSLPAFTAASIAGITILTTFFFLPETVKKSKEIKTDFKIVDIQNFKKYFSNPKLALKLWQFFSFVLSHMIFTSSIALYVNYQFGLGASFIGFSMTYVGIISVIFRGGILRKLIDKFGEEKLRYIGIGLVFIGLLSITIVTKPWMFYVVTTFFAIGSGMSRPLLLGNISRSVSEKEQGSILGITSSLGSVAQIFGPLIGFFAIQYISANSIGLISSFIVLTTVFTLLQQKKKKRKSIT